ncbi:hypothetical protein ACLKA7_012809 [Drosophila subpalustris]
MAQPQLLQIKLSRFDAQPWGFRLQGGVDFAQPLLVQKVNAGSLSEQAGLQPGDAVIKINDVDVFNFRHKDAQDVVVRSGNNFVITVQRGGSTWRPHVTPTGNVPQANSPYLQTVTKTSLAHHQPDSQHIGCGYNNSARPFANGGGDGGVKSIVNKQYNTPVGIYSDESIAETLSAQAEVLAGGVLGVNFKKNEKEYQADRSEVLKFLREEETGQSTPEPHSPANFYWTQSHAIGGNERRTPLPHSQFESQTQSQSHSAGHQQDERIGSNLQPNTLAPLATHRPSLPVAKPQQQQPQLEETEQQPEPDPRSIVMPICPALQGPDYKADKDAAMPADDGHGGVRTLSASGHPACQLCGVGIVGVFVRIKDKNLHVECFKCATCGTSLKNQGYYNFNNKLYCDIHAKLAAQNHPPAGTEGYVPVPIKPNTKLSASTISSALSSHGYGSNGYSNGNATPTPAPSEPMPLAEPDPATSELPLPPPPSPTQLLQYETEELLLLPPNQTQTSAPQQQPQQQQQQQQQDSSKHTRTNSSLSSISSGSSSSSGVGGSAALSPSLVASSASTLSLDMDGSSPLHSRQTSGSCTSLDVGVVSGQVDNYTMLAASSSSPPTPPPPPPPPTSSTPSSRSTQNENDMNTQNKNHNAYNQLLKQYSNKLQHSNQHHNNNNSNNNTHTTSITTTIRHNNTAKPFATTTASTVQQQPHVAALTATLANQLKFNSHQAQTTATATAVDNIKQVQAQSEIMSANVADEQSSAIYGQINSNSNNSYNNNNSNNYNDNAACSVPTMQTTANVASASAADQPFEYVTLTGNVIRSVQPPGKGQGANYRVNQGYARPYGASQPPAAAPKSPVSVAYPPQQQQQQSARPAGNAYATLPRSNVGQQELEEEGLQPQFEEECFEVDVEVAMAASRRTHGSSFSWPPPQDESHAAPTAAPLYIAPPETQHVVVANPVQEVPPLPPGSATSRLDPQPQQQQEQKATPQQPAPQWQSYSAPQLSKQRPQQLQVQEQESSSDSYTSTSTTTTTTSEEYQRMYAAQLQAYQMQQAYEQSGSELDYQVDYGSGQDVHEYASGRRSAQECVDSLSAPLSTYKLIDMVREVTPSPVPASTPAPPPPARHVAFNDEPEIKELPPPLHTELETIPESAAEAEQAPSAAADVPDWAEDDREGLIIDQRCQILESERMFQPTPEINLEIAPVRQRPAPSKIPNPMPKEWINPMVRVLTTASDVPFHLVECPFPRPCGDDFEAEAAAAAAAVEEAAARPAPAPAAPPVVAAPPPVAPPTDSYASELLRESPPLGSRLSKAMATAPEFEVRFAPPAAEGVPLPEETVPYMPPPMDMKPYLREDYRPKSPFVSALTTAPERPFEGHFDRDVPIHLIDLPTPKEHLSMIDALCTASDRGYTPLNPENATQRIDEEQKQQELKKYEFQVLDHEEELGIKPQPPESVEYYKTQEDPQERRKSSAFAAMQAFQPSREPLTSSSTSNTVTNTPRASIVSMSKDQTDLEYQKYCKAQQRNQKRLDFYHKKEEELQTQQQQLHQQYTETNTLNSNSLVTASNATASSNSSSTVQQSTNSTNINNNNNNNNSAYAAQSQVQMQNNRASFSASNAASTLTAVKTTTACASAASSVHASKIDAHELIEETAEELEHSEVLFPPPSPLSHLKGKAVQSGLHKADAIPKYQRNWTVLPTQSPIRTPEPQELRDNVPLAFVDAPKADTVHKPIAKVSGGNGTASAPTAARGSIVSVQGQAKPVVQPSVPIIIEDRSGPVTMAFQSLDEFERPDQSQTPTRPYTPCSVSSLINKPAPIIPFYQTPEKLCFEECSATHARAYDQGAASPFPDRARSPAPGPPPNPLAAIRAPRMKEPESNLLSVAGPRVQAGSITTGQSYQGQLLAHSELSSQSGSQSYTQQPETVTERQIGNLSVQQREQSSMLQQQKQAQLESETKTQIGNMQIERRRKVTEEFERTQSAKTIEIRTGSKTQSQIQSQSQSQSQSQQSQMQSLHSQQTQLQSQQSQGLSESTERRQSYGRTGFVANQARRLSGLEQEITSLTSQSQAISARASTLGEGNFPQLRSPTFDSKFPLHHAPAAEAVSPNSCGTASTANKLLGPPPGFLQQQQQKSAFSSSSKSAAATVTAPQQQLRPQSSSLTSAASAMPSSSLSSSASASASTSASASRSAQASLTKASAITTTTNNQACAAFRSTGPGNGYNNSATAAAAATLANLANSNNASIAAPSKPKTTAITPAPASFPPNLSDLNSNVDDSTGPGGKSGAFGATSAPKRGRGILNKAAGPAPLAKPINLHANQTATLPRPQKTADNESSATTDADQDTDATALLAESIGRINMGEQTNAFMQEAGKIISNMLEARLAGNGSATPSHAGSTLSLRSNSSSNLSKSPMIVRKRLDLDDFKNIDPTQPVALQTVVAVPALQPQQQQQQKQVPQQQMPQVARVEQTLPAELPQQHPMSKILDICDSGKMTTEQQAPEPVAFRNNLRRTGATHATRADRRSYIEPKQTSPADNNSNSNNNNNNNNSTISNNSQTNTPSFSVCVKALGPQADAQGPMSEENEKAVSQLLKDGKRPICCQCSKEITSGPFITALGRIWCPDHFICVNGNCRRPLQDIGFVEEKGDLYCEYCFEKYLAPTCSKCAGKIKGDCLNAIGKHFHPECFTCGQCGKVFGNTPFFLEDGNAYCEADWNELFTTKCFACGFPVEAGDRWVEALNHNYHSQCFNCTFCKQNLEGQSFYNKGGRPFCKNHAR